MSRFLLIRHAAVELAANLIGGRSPGIHLSAGGREQARRLTAMLSAESIRAIYASPRARARETAQAIAEQLYKAPQGPQDPAGSNVKDAEVVDGEYAEASK